jgi:hypothetical protein
MFIWLLVCAVLFIVLICGLGFLKKRIKPLSAEEPQIKVDKPLTYFDSRQAICKAFRKEKR